MEFVIIPRRRSQAAIAGRVLDARTRAVVPGVEVAITSMPDALRVCPDPASTSSDGVFHFCDLPDGRYTLSFSIAGGEARYGAAAATVTVSRDADGTVTTGAISVDLPPTGAEGQVQIQVPPLDPTGQPTTTPLPMARVRVQGSGESAYSDASGRFYLTGADPGPRVLTFSAPGCAPASAPVAIQTGVVTTATTVTLLLAP